MPHLVKKLKCQIITSCYDSFKNLNWHVSFLWLLLALRSGSHRLSKVRESMILDLAVVLVRDSRLPNNCLEYKKQRWFIIRLR